MTSRLIRTVFIGGLGLVAVVPLGSVNASSRADDPNAQDAPTAKALEASRRLVAELQAQVEEQRSALKKAEDRLRKARELLVELEGTRALDPALVRLKAQEEKISARAQEIQRLIRSPFDPSFVRTQQQLEEVREKIKKIEAR